MKKLVQISNWTIEQQRKLSLYRNYYKGKNQNYMNETEYITMAINNQLAKDGEKYDRSSNSNDEYAGKNNLA